MIVKLKASVYVCVRAPVCVFCSKFLNMRLLNIFLQWDHEGSEHVWITLDHGWSFPATSHIR